MPCQQSIRGKIPSLMEHIATIYSSTTERIEFKRLLRDGCSAIMSEPIARHNRLYSKTRNSIRKRSMRSLSNAAAPHETAGCVPPGCVDYDRMRKLVQYKLYPQLKEADFLSLWRHLDEENKGYVSAALAEQGFSRLSKIRGLDLQDSLADPGRYAPTFKVTDRRVKGFQIDTAARFNEPKSLTVDLEYDYDDRVVRSRPPEWGIGKEDIRFGYNLTGRHWTHIQPHTTGPRIPIAKEQLLRPSPPKESKQRNKGGYDRRSKGDGSNDKK